MLADVVKCMWMFLVWEEDGINCVKCWFNFCHNDIVKLSQSKQSKLYSFNHQDLFIALVKEVLIA